MADKKGSAGEKLLCCPFCGKGQHGIEKLIVDPPVFICDECIDLRNKIVQDEAAIPEKEGGLTVKSDLSTSHKIRQSLDQYVAGQGQAEKILAIAAYNHYKHLRHLGKKDDIELSKSNVLFIGPTGSGKTLLAQTLARLLNVPFVIADATTLTKVGYVGEDTENVIQKLLQNCNYEVDKAQRGIVYIGEVDKISYESDNPSIIQDVSGENVQQALFKLVEGTTTSVPPQGGRRYPNQDLLQVGTINILFICGNTFDDLEKIIIRCSNKTGIDFGAEVQNKEEHDVSEVLPQMEPEDLIEFGLIPELIGRLPAAAMLARLDEAALMKILVEPKNAIAKQYQKLLTMEGVGLEIRPSALTAITCKAIKRKTGTRGLCSIVEYALMDVVHDFPNHKGTQKAVIDEGTISDEGKSLLVYEEQPKVAGSS